MTEPEEEVESPREKLIAALEGPRGALREAVEEMHPADIAEAMLDLSERQAWVVFDALDLEGRAAIFTHAEDSLSEQLLEQITPRQLAAIIEELPPDDVVDLLALADPEDAERILRTVDFERARGLRKLAAHDPETAGGLMTTEYLAVPRGTRIGDAIKLLKGEGEDVEEGLGTYIVDEENKPVGYVTDRALLTNSIHDTVDSVMADPISVPVEMDQEEVAHQVLHYDLAEIAVVDSGGALVGVITADDAQEVLAEEAREDILRIVGTSPEQQTRLPILKRVRGRLPLQAVTVCGGLLTAWVIEHALGEAEVTRSTDMLRFLPIILGLAGNVGVQASTILVRAFATGEVEREREANVLLSEMLVGLIIGLICGSLTFAVISLTDPGDDSVRFGSAIGMAITTAVVWAATLGCVVPMGCRRIKIDPAIVAGPFLITVSDISGTVLYLVVARLLIGF